MQTDAREKRQALRLERIDDGVALLTRWLEDLMRQGLGRLATRGLDLDTMARRLNDCQAQGLARRMSSLEALRPELVGSVGPLLVELGGLALTCEAWRQRHALGALRSTVERLIGLTLTEAQALEVGERVTDHWMVLGQHVAYDPTTRFTATRTWLLGEHSQRFALHLAYAFGDEGFGEARARDRLAFDARLRSTPGEPEDEPSPPVLFAGKALAATLAFFPGAVPLRAAFAECTASTLLPRRRLRLPRREGLAHWLNLFAEGLGLDPFLERHPVLLGDVRLGLRRDELDGELAPSRARGHAGEPHALARGVDDEGRATAQILDGADALPLAPLGASDLATLAAVTGGAAFDLVAEWDGRALVPLAVITDVGLTPLTRPTSGPTTRRDPPPDADLAALERVATLGTSSGPPLSPLPAHLAPFAPLLAGRSPEATLLLRAALVSLARRAGLGPSPGLPPVPEAPPEARPEATGRLAAVLARALPEHELRDELASLLEARGLRLPTVLIPLAAELGFGLDPASRAAAGERLGWLEALGLAAKPSRPRVQPSPQPRPATDNSDLVPLIDPSTLPDLLARIAGHGPDGTPLPFAERSGALFRARLLDPDAARAALEPVLASERPEQRRVLLLTLGEGLRPSDRPLLERALKDRARLVRASAAELLQGLPDSDVARRITARAEATLRLVEGRVVLTYPRVDPDWAADGLDEGPVGSLSPADALLVHLVERVSPQFWEAHLGLAPRDLLRQLWNVDPIAAREPLYAGLAGAAVRFRTIAWIEPLWVAFAALGGRPPAALFQVAPARDRRRLFELRLAHAGRLKDGDEALLADLPPPFGPAISKALMDWFNQLGPGRYAGAHPLAAHLRRLALGLELVDLRALFGRPELNRSHDLRQLVQTRLILHQELADV